MPESALKVRDVHGWYGESHVLHGVDLCVDADPARPRTVPVFANPMVFEAIRVEEARESAARSRGDAFGSQDGDEQ